MRQLSRNHFYRLHNDTFQLVSVVDGNVVDVVDSVDVIAVVVANVVVAVAAANLLANCHLSNIRGKQAAPI